MRELRISRRSGEVRILYPVRNNAALLPPGQRPSGPAAAAGLDFRIIPAGFNPLRQRLRGECPPGISNGVYFAFANRRLVLLHGFVKKTRKTPKHEIDIAERRLNDFINREGGKR